MIARLVKLGISEQNSAPLNAKISLVNKISYFIIPGLILLSFSYYDTPQSFWSFISAALILTVVPLLNAMGFTRVSRYLFCLLPPVLVTLFSGLMMNEASFIGVFLLLPCMLLPSVFFLSEERTGIYTGFAVVLLSAVFFDEWVRAIPVIMEFPRGELNSVQEHRALILFVIMCFSIPVYFNGQNQEKLRKSLLDQKEKLRLKNVEINERLDEQKIRLENQQEKLRLALKASNQLVYEYDKRNNTFEVTGETDKVTGNIKRVMTPVRHHFTNLIDVKQFPGVVHDYEKRVKDGERLIKSEYCIPGPDGRRKWFYDINYILETEGGVPVHSTGTLIDITSIKKAQDRLEEILGYSDLVTRVSTNFNRFLPFEEQVKLNMRELVKKFEVSRSFMATVNPETGNLDLAGYWKKSLHVSDPLDGVRSFDINTELPSLKEYFTQNKTLKYKAGDPNREKLPADFVAFFEKYGIQSILMGSMIQQSKLLGFAGILDFYEKKPLTSATVNCIQTVGYIFATAYQAKLAGEKSRSKKAEPLKESPSVEFRGRGMIVYHVKKGEYKLSSGMSQLTGHDQHLFGSPEDLFYPEDKLKVEQLLKRGASKSSKRVEAKIRTIWENPLYVYLQAKKTENDKIYIAVTDITKLKEKHNQLALALETSKIGFWDWHVQTDGFFVSDSFYTITGLAKSKKEFRDLIKLLPGPEIKKAVTVRQEYLRGNIESYENEYNIKLPSGENKWFYSRSKLIEKTKNGQPVRVIGILVDINNEVKARKGLEIKNKQIKKQAFSLAHEIRLPASNIQGLVDLLMQSETEENEFIRALQVSSKELDESIRKLTRQMESPN